MKNIHLIPTDKPSRIYLIKSTNKLDITSNNPEFTENFGSGTQNQHIYITDNSEIKIGDWVIDKHNVVYKQETDKIFTEFNGAKKIILTTDQDLIKEGVQAIDDEFLQWFVKNPSCEWVDVKYQYWEGRYTYKIIIPKQLPTVTMEEFIQELDEKFPIQEAKHHKSNLVKISSEEIEANRCKAYKLLDLENKETLEEVKDLKYWKNNAEEDYITTPISVLRYISQLEQEQDKNNYSEEEVLKFAVFYHGYKDLIKTEKWEVIEMTKEFLLKEWFEQFKKK
jgi:hypothetical protein